MKKRVAVFISGRGSNFHSIIEHPKNVGCHYEVVLCVTNNLAALGLQYANDNGIPVEVYSEDTIHQILNNYKVELVALAGFMKILTPEFCNQWEGKILNIHPSLLPNYSGLNTHKRVLENNEKEHGLSIHFVDAGVDTGPIIFQTRVNIEDIENEEVLANLILFYENWFYPLILDVVAEGRIYLKEGRVYNCEKMLENPYTFIVD